MLKIKIVAGFLVFTVLPLFSLGEDPFNSVKDLFRNGGESEEIILLLDNIERENSPITEGEDLFLAELYRLKGFALLMDKKEDEAKEFLQKSIGYAESINREKESPRALFYLSSSGFMLAGVEGARAIISQSETLNGYTDRALELSPDDPEIIYQKAASLAYPPKLFGGNREEAIELLERGLNLPDLAKYNKLDLLSTLSYCYQKEKKYVKALQIAEEALELYPENKDLQERRDELKKKVK